MAVQLAEFLLLDAKDFLRALNDVRRGKNRDGQGHQGYQSEQGADRQHHHEDADYRANIADELAVGFPRSVLLMLSVSFVMRLMISP